MKSAGKRITEILLGLGVWPACVMVSVQFVFMVNLQVTLRLIILFVTFFGTLSVYALDRTLEKRVGFKLARRHYHHILLTAVVLIFTFIFLIFLIQHITSREMRWLIILVLAGSLYLSMTSGLIKLVPGVKELLGAALFTWLCLGLVAGNNKLLYSSFFMMAWSNFIWSGFFDRDRDRKNNLRSLAVIYGKKTVFFARLTAFLSIPGYVIVGVPLSLIGVSVLHGVWPKHLPQVDCAFMPVVCHALLLLLFA